MKLPPFYDAVAAVVTIMLVAAVVLYPIFGVDAPELISSGFALALGWTFRATVAATNGVNRLKGGTPNGSASPVGAAGPGPQ
jgi:uncharacterized membrane protein YjjB (DUF3815 family)